ncbi:M23 family peptidase, partial [Rhizobiaceae sp. 2RAB30]
MLTLDRDEIAKRLSLGGRRGAEAARLGVAQFGIVFMHLSLDATYSVPRSLVHRIAARMDRPDMEFSMMLAKTQVDDR